MEVNLSNYLVILPEIIRKLKTAAFISFDAEYTGLKSIEGETTSLFDDIPERYLKLRRVVLNNSAPQFGIAIFQRQESKNNVTEQQQQVYSVDAYSLYVMEPSFADFNMKRTKATVEIDCCQFLNSINLNFESWMQQAVPYLNKSRVKELEKYIEDNPYFLEKCKDNRPFNKILFPKNVKNLPMLKTCKLDLVRKLRGFAAITDTISKMKIPVVGHNMVLDLMYFFHLFCSDLPETYACFRAEVIKFLPVVFDTKYMTVRCRKMLDHPDYPKHCISDKALLYCSGLYIIYKTTSAITDKFSPRVKLSRSCKYFERDLELGKQQDLEETCASKLCHQPAFDACVTGMVFLNLAHVACRISKKTLAPHFEEVLSCIRHWQDQVFLARASVMTLSLKGRDAQPNRWWVRVSSDKGQKANELEIMTLLKSYPQLKEQMAGVDVIEGENEVFLAVTRAQCANELRAVLKEKGYELQRILIRWNNKLYESVKGQKDSVYDTGRNKLLTS